MFMVLHNIERAGHFPHVETTKNIQNEISCLITPGGRIVVS